MATAEASIIAALGLFKANLLPSCMVLIIVFRYFTFRVDSVLVNFTLKKITDT
jgi:hypothetical protein